MQEAKLMQNLRHNNIVQLFGIVNHVKAGNMYIASALATNGNLFQYIEKIQSELGSVPHLLSTLQLSLGIAHGVCYLHQRKIIHRDLKPQNILLFEGEIPKITDFGMSRTLYQKSRLSVASKSSKAELQIPLLDVLEYEIENESAATLTYSILDLLLLLCMVF